MVTEIMTGRRSPFSSKTFSIATMPALATSVSKIVSRRMMSEPPSMRPRTCVSNAARISSNVTARNAGLLTSGEIDSVRFVGPIDPATKRGLSGSFAVHSSAAARARRAPSTLISYANGSSS